MMIVINNGTVELFLELSIGEFTNETETDHICFASVRF